MPAVTHTVPVHRVRTAAQPRENSRGSPWYAACCLSSVMERAFVLFPMVSAAAGSLLDGLGGAVWSAHSSGTASRGWALRDALTMRYDRYGWHGHMRRRSDLAGSIRVGSGSTSARRSLPAAWRSARNGRATTVVRAVGK
jgi:hypothetical protein